ncbi:hypothetical protein YC2023_024226 [Brassica napus]
MVVDGGLWLSKPRHLAKEAVKELSRVVEKRSRAKPVEPLLTGAPFQGTWARSVAEDASPDYNSNAEDIRFSSWALPGSLAVTKGILGDSIRFRRRTDHQNDRFGRSTQSFLAANGFDALENPMEDLVR